MLGFVLLITLSASYILISEAFVSRRSCVVFKHIFQLSCKRVLTIKKMDLLESARKIREEVDKLETKQNDRNFLNSGFEAAPPKMVNPIVEFLAE